MNIWQGEKIINNVGELLDWIARSPEFFKGEPSIVWRGVKDASWGLHSSLYRHLRNSGQLPAANNEGVMRDAEADILANATRWGLRTDGKLTALELLARLQHHGTPTRLLDVTFNPLTAAFFAVQGDGLDGRIIAFNSEHNSIDNLPGPGQGWPNYVDELRKWARCYERPWVGIQGPGLQSIWDNGFVVWTPPAIDARIVVQQGAFLFGSTPSLAPETSVTIEHQITGKKYRSARVSASAKKPIREFLDTCCGQNFRRLFPDFPGFTSYRNR